MLTSMQGSDVIADWTTLKRDEANMATFSKEAGGTIKAYNNYIEAETVLYLIRKTIPNLTDML